MMDEIGKNLLKEVAELDALPVGAYNIRVNGESSERNTTANIDIVSKEDKSGIDIIIRPGTVNESVHIPVILSQSGLKETVYNDFYVGEDCDITIVAGCGIHNCGTADSEHSGIHRFFLKKNARVRYVEKHYGEGEGRGKRVMNPTTEIHLDEGASFTMEATQIAGIDDTIRKTTATVGENASLEVQEKILTTGEQNAVSDFTAELNGKDSSCNIVSRTVAKDKSTQHFSSTLIGNAPCSGHTECDSIIMDGAKVSASPNLTAADVDAGLIHEAAIGKIAGEQLLKLMTLGLTEEEAEQRIVNGFLK
ncbi:MAG: SufD family Fe-S cluster assembly protein [Lachnospiraceae bacterium]|nr:SufD family Fe-S cluster assembly protein [Lachnospiraceae bacterium]